MEATGEDGKEKESIARSDIDASDISGVNPSLTQENLPTKTKSHDAPFPTVQNQLQIGEPRQLHLNNHERQNKCYIINNSFARWKDMSLKEQYTIDEREIGKTFSWLNFEVKVKRDLDHASMEKFLRQRTLKDYSDQDCIVFFILSHGTDQGDFICADRRRYKVDTMVEKIQNIQSLVDKPKLFFIQACRGVKDMEAVDLEPAVRPAGGAHPDRIAKKSNTFVYYSTMQGNRSYCSTYTGSFFIHVLTQVLLEYHKNVNAVPKYHFGEITTVVNDVLSTHVRDHVLEGENEMKSLVQVSEVRSSLCQNIYFYPNPTKYEQYLREMKDQMNY